MGNTNPEIRRRAFAAVKPSLTAALIVSFAAELPLLLTELFNQLAMNPLNSFLYAFAESDPTLYTMERLESEIMGALAANRTMLLAMALLGLAAFLVSPFLSLGRYHFSLKLLRGEPAEAKDVLSRAGIFFKALGQSLYLVLKLFLWSLPGMGVMILSMVPLFISPSMTTISLFMMGYLGGFGGSIALMFLAQLRYSLAPILLADKPATGIRESVRVSKQLMAGHKGQMFRMMFFFFGMNMLLNIALNMTLGNMQAMMELGGAAQFASFLSILITTASLAGQLVISVFHQASLAGFYEAYAHPDAQMAAEEKLIEEN